MERKKIFRSVWFWVALFVLGALSGLSANDAAIPLIDISSEKNRQVIVDREEGQYLGHVTTVLLEDDKTILAVYPKGHGKGGIILKRSDDGGSTWSARLPVPGAGVGRCAAALR